MNNVCHSLPVIIFIIIIVLIVILIFSYRDIIVGAFRPVNVDLITTEQALLRGFGYYGDSVDGECVTTTIPSHCGETGSKTVTRQCIPNPKTGRGCIGPNGKQSFATIVDTQACTIMCRSSIWTNEVKGVCILPPLSTLSPGGSKICYPPDTKGEQTITKTCVAHDAVGINSCIYEQPPPPNSGGGSGTTIPPECTQDPIGSTVTCNIGYTLQTTQPCDVDLGSQICGEWVLPNGNSCMYSNTQGNFNICRGPTGIPYTNETDLLSAGWADIPMVCLAPTGVSGICEPIPPVSNKETGGCVTQSQAFDALSKSQTTSQPVILCGTPPGCVRSCTFTSTSSFINGVGAGVDRWVPELQALIGNAQILAQSVGSDIYGLGLNNVPCPGPEGKFIEGASIRTTVELSDCFGDPLFPLENTPCLWINATSIASRPSTFGISSICTNAEDILRMSSLYITFVPTQLVSVSGPNVLRCNILGVLGKNYTGYLNRFGQNVIWVQTDINTLQESKASEFIVTLTNEGKLNIRFDDNSNIITPSTGPMSPLTFNSVTPIQRISLDASTINSFYIILNQRQTRLNPQSCNIMYSYPPPPSYPRPDIAT